MTQKANDIIFFDTETNGFPKWKEPSGGENQPHIVQLAAVVVDLNSREITESMDVIVKPDGWDISQDTIDVHGITKEHALDVGIPEEEAMEKFIQLWDGRKRVAYNTTFDNRIIRIATKRYSSESAIENWKVGEYECAMQAARKAMKVKSVKLIDAYKHFTGEEIENAHSAMADTIACMKVYFAVKDQG